MASAISLISFSSTFTPNVFQLFQPIGGVGASPANFWAKTDMGRHKIMSKTSLFIFVGSLNWLQELICFPTRPFLSAAALYVNMRLLFSHQELRPPHPDAVAFALKRRGMRVVGHHVL